MLEILALSLIAVALIGALKPTWFRILGEWTRRVRTWHVLCLLAIPLAIVALHDGWAVITLMVAVAFVLFWMYELYVLMHLSDDVFPGRNDKVLWVLILVVLAPIGAMLFRAFRKARWPEAKPVPDRAMNDLV